MTCTALSIVIIAAWWWRTARRTPQDEPPPTSIVLLLRQPRNVDASTLAKLLSDVTGSRVEAIDADFKQVLRSRDRTQGDFVAGTTAHFVAHIRNTAFAIHNLESPYMDEPLQASQSISDMRLSKAVREHKAWLSMDIIQSQESSSDNYRIIAKVLANMIGLDCVALYHPPSQKFAPYSDTTIDRLKSDDPIKALFEEMNLVPVIPIDDDPRMKAAEAEARRRFPEFESAFRARAGDDFSIKASISRGGNTEHIWISVDEIDKDGIKGRLGNEPVDLADLKIGSKVQVRRDEVEDWIFMRGGSPVGVFSVPVIQQIEQERSRKK